MTTLLPPGWAPPAVVRSNPYVGPRSLRNGEPIYGRRREIAEIRGLLTSRRIVLLYSPSGAGKTSLIEAGVVPELVARDFHVLPTIRVGFDLDEPNGNRYFHSVLSCLEGARSTASGYDGAAPRSFADALGPARAEAGDRPLCLIFDQFEELFTLDPTDVAAKHQFAQAVGALLEDRNIWALFALREDFIAQLDPYLDHFPTGLRTRVRLDLLSPDAARDCVREPAATTGVRFEDDAVTALVDDLRQTQVERLGRTVTELGPYVEPLHLQVVCRRLWTPDVSLIRTADIALSGGVDKALAEYYESEVTGVVGATGVDETQLRAWFSHELITEDGYRRQTRDGPGRRGEDVLEYLDHAYLIRPERRRGTDWYELTHDRFVAPIRESNRRARAARARRRTRWAFGIALAVVVLLATAVVAVLLPAADAEPAVADQRVTVGSRTPITLGPGETRRFRVDGSDAGIVAILTADTNAPTTAQLRLYSLVGNDAQTQIASSDLAPVEVPNQLLPSSGQKSASTLNGTASVESPPGWPTTSFIVQIRSETGGPFELAIEQQESSTGTSDSTRRQLSTDATEDEIARAGDLRFYDLTPSAGADLAKVVVTPTDPPEGGLDPVITLRDEQTAVIGYADAFGPGWVETLVVPTDDGATVEISGYETSVGSYSVTAEWFHSDTLVLDAAVVEGELSATASERWFTMELTDDQVVRLTVNPSGDLDAQLELRDASGAELGWSDSAVAGPENVVTELVGPASYLVGVVAVDETVGGFTLTAQSIDPVGLSLGDTADGTISASAATATYSFDGVIDQPVQVVVRPASDTMDVVVAELGRDPIDDYFKGTPETLVLIPSATAPLFVEVSGYEGDLGAFTIAVESLDPAPETLEDGVEVGAVGEPGAVGLFDVSAIANEASNLQIEVVPQGDLVVRLRILTPFGSFDFGDGRGEPALAELDDVLRGLDVPVLASVTAVEGSGGFTIRATASG